MDQLPSIKLGDFTLEFELGNPSVEIQEVAKKELRESPDIVKQGVTELRELLKGKISLDNDFKIVELTDLPRFQPNSISSVPWRTTPG